jgi:adenosylcobinamide-GDP ribazoletransferase
MKSIVSSFIIALSMYSKIPMPKTDWKEENMKYVMCFFPMIGAVIGGLVYFWSHMEGTIPISRTLYTIIIILIPVIITGGIHLDGLLDTADALSSYQPMEKKLEILKDSNSGAFAVITCVVYFLLAYGVWYDASPTVIPILSIGFVLSRALSGLAVVTFPLAKKSGLATMFSNHAKKQITRIIMMIYILLCMAGMLLIHWVLGILCILGAMSVFAYYRYMSSKEFGGITGDLAGFFLQICELIMAVFVIIGDKLCG